MGNGLSPCTRLPAAAPTAAKLIYWGGQTRMAINDDGGDGGCCCFSTAGEVAAELPGCHLVCPADCFFVGLPIPVMSPGERLLPGWTYFVLPADRFPSGLKALTAATLASLSAAPGNKKAMCIAGPGQCPFEYIKGEDGAAPLIRVLPEFIEKVISCDGNGAGRLGSKCRGLGAVTTELCSTPELKRHYAQLVGPRNQPWSPRLETISERSKRRILRSPARLLSFRDRRRACASSQTNVHID